MKSWISYPSDCDFSIHNIPFGVIAFNNQIVLASAIGGYAVNLYELCMSELIEGSPDLYKTHTLNLLPKASHLLLGFGFKFNNYFRIINPH